MPQVRSGLVLLPGDPILDDLRRGRDVGAEQLAVALETRQAALRRGAGAEIWSDIGLIRFAQARGAGFDSDIGRTLLAQSLSAGRQSVGRAPASAYVWMRLAQAEFLRNGITERLGRYLDMAMRTAPADRRLLYPRLDLALFIWPNLIDESRARVAAQIRMAARVSPARLATVTRQRHALAIVRRGLRPAPALLADFDAAYLKPRP